MICAFCSCEVNVFASPKLVLSSIRKDSSLGPAYYHTAVEVTNEVSIVCIESTFVTAVSSWNATAAAAAEEDRLAGTSTSAAAAPFPASSFSRNILISISTFSLSDLSFRHSLIIWVFIP